MNSKTTLTRKELFNEVWTFPLTKLADKYAISDSGLRKICVKHHIPLPKSGHWSKAKFGKAPKSPKLPPSNHRFEPITLILRREGESYIPSSNPIINRQREIEDTGVLLELEKDFRKADPLVRRTKKFLEMKHNFGTNRDAWLNARELSIGVDVSKEQIRRGLLIIDRVVKILRQRGHEVIVRNSNAYVQSNGEEIDFRMREKQNASFNENNYGWKERTLTPSGRLIIQMEYGYWCKEWIDKKQPLENQISKIIANMELRLEEKKQERIDREERRKQEEIEKTKQELIKRTHSEELTATKELFAQMERWKRVKEMEVFISEMGEIKPKEWIQWAKYKVDWYNPAIQKKDPILKTEDRREVDEVFKPKMKVERRFGW